MRDCCSWFNIIFNIIFDWAPIVRRHTRREIPRIRFWLDRVIGPDRSGRSIRLPSIFVASDEFPSAYVLTGLPNVLRLPRTWRIYSAPDRWWRRRGYCFYAYMLTDRSTRDRSPFPRSITPTLKPWLTLNGLNAVQCDGTGAMSRTLLYCEISRIWACNLTERFYWTMKIVRLTRRAPLVSGTLGTKCMIKKKKKSFL